MKPNRRETISLLAGAAPAGFGMLFVAGLTNPTQAQEAELRRTAETTGPNPRNFTTSVTFNGPAKPISGRFRRFRLQRGSAALRNSSAPGTDRSLRSVLRGEARHPHRQRHDTVLSRVRRSLLRAVGYGDPAARRARWDQ